MDITVAIVGSPLSGKRSFLEQLADDTPEVTVLRSDRKLAYEHEHRGARHRVTVFAAVEFANEPPNLTPREAELSKAAREILEADVVVFVADAQAVRYDATIHALTKLSAVLGLIEGKLPVFLINKLDLDTEGGAEQLANLLEEKFEGAPVHQGSLVGDGASALVRKVLEKAIADAQAHPEPRRDRPASAGIERSSSQVIGLLYEQQSAAKRALQQCTAQPELYTEQDKQSLLEHIDELQRKIDEVNPSLVPRPVSGPHLQPVPRASLTSFWSRSRAVEETLLLWMLTFGTVAMCALVCVIIKVFVPAIPMGMQKMFIVAFALPLGMSLVNALVAAPLRKRILRRAHEGKKVAGILSNVFASHERLALPGAS